MTAEQYAEYTESLYAEDPVLTAVHESIAARGMTNMSVKPGYGRLLTLLVAASGARRALEIGAFGGYSAICLARGMGADGTVVSLELKPQFAELAAENVAAAGFGPQVSYRVGEALKSLEELETEGKTFDFFFIDADKGNYPSYLDWALRLGTPGALIVGDNTLLNGRVPNPAKSSPSVLAVRAFNERIAADPRLQSTMLPAYDGLAIARIRSK